MANHVDHAAAPPASIGATGPPAGRADLTARSRERILRAALAEFAIKGFDGTTTAAIARHAGVTQPLVHYHFTSKIVLWKAAVHSAFARMHGLLAQLVVDAQRAGRLRADVDADFTAQLLYQMLSAGRTAVVSGQLDADQAVERIMNQFLNGAGTH